MLKAHFRSREEFLESYLSDLPGGGIFFPTRKNMLAGDPVIVSVRVGRQRSPMLLSGSVAWRRGGRRRPAVKAGVGIEFLASEAAKRDYLLALAHGARGEHGERRHQRLPVNLPVSWRLNGEPHDLIGVLRDIGPGGAFVGTDEPTMALHDAQVVLNLSHPGAEVATPIQARVAWVGHYGGDPGFGVEWRARDPGGGRRIRELVRRIEQLLDV